jgi:hypothetical protein
MKRWLSATFVLLVALAFAGAASAAELVWSNQTASSGTGSEIPVPAHYVLNVMVCGTGYTGTVTIYQGPATGKVAATKTITTTTNSDCSNYYTLNPSSIIRIDFTLSAGTLAAVYVEHWK